MTAVAAETGEFCLSIVSHSFIHSFGPVYFFQDFCFGAVMDKLGYKISGRHDGRHNTCIMHLGEHLGLQCSLM